MTITNGYCTEAELRNEIDLNDVTAGPTAKYERAISAASRMIDKETGWTNHGFWLDDTATSRVYFTDDTTCLDIPEGIGSLTGLTIKTDDNGDGTYVTTLADTDYVLTPSNAITDGKPYTEIRLINSAGFVQSPYAPPYVQITAKFGWPAVPDEVKEACLFQAAMFLKSAASPGGVLELTGFDGTGIRLPRLHPQAAALLTGVSKVYA